MSQSRSCGGFGWVVIGLVGAAVLCGCGPRVLPPPVAVSVRGSLVGNGQVLRITNTSNDHLHSVTLSVSGRGANKSGVIADTLKPHETIEFGWLEAGFALRPGMTIEIQAAGFGGRFKDTLRE